MMCHIPQKLLKTELKGVEGETACRAGHHLLSAYIVSGSILILQTFKFNFTNITSFNVHSIS